MTGNGYLQSANTYYNVLTGLSQSDLLTKLNVVRAELLRFLQEYPSEVIIPTVSGQSDYTIPPSTAVKEVFFTYTASPPYVRSFAMRKIGLDDFSILQFSGGYPLYYAFVSPTSIRVYPTPTIESCNLYVKYFPTLQVMYNISNLNATDTDINDNYGEIVAVRLAKKIAIADGQASYVQFLNAMEQDISIHLTRLI